MILIRSRSSSCSIICFRIIDPTSLNRQGNDVGTSYRTGIYPACAEDEAIARQFVAERQKDYDRPIVTEVERLVCFYDAEQEHQDYLVRHPQGYCHVDFSGDAAAGAESIAGNLRY